MARGGFFLLPASRKWISPDQVVWLFPAGMYEKFIKIKHIGARV
jgi:hypothetical protein